MALGVVVALAGMSALAWRLRVAPESRGHRQANFDGGRAPAAATVQALPRLQRRADAADAAGAVGAVASAPGQPSRSNGGANEPAAPDVRRAAAGEPVMQAVADLLPGQGNAEGRPVSADGGSASVAVAMPLSELPAPAIPLPAAQQSSAQPVPWSGPIVATPAADTAVGDVPGAPAPGEDDQPLDAQPPATADSLPVQQAWLQRIAELDAAGDAAGARESLAVFRQRFPGVAIPDGLRALEP